MYIRAIKRQTIFTHISATLLLILMVSIPLFVHAQTLPTIIPCGTQANPASCEVCHLYILASNIIDFLLIIIIPLAALVIAYGGFLYLTSGGSPGSADKGKRAIRSGIFGIIIAFFAWVIINTIISVLSNGTLTDWNQFPSCPGA